MPAASRTQALCPRLTSTFWTDTIGIGAVAVIGDGDPVPLPGTPWSIRPAAGPAGRPAVEIYAAGSMLDVMVAPALAARILRGVRPSPALALLEPNAHPGLATRLLAAMRA